MDESKIYFRTGESDGIISISPDVVSGIASDACIETPGVAGMACAPSGGNRGVVINFSDDSCHVEAFILVRNGFVIAEVAKEVQIAVKSAIEAGCGIRVAKADIFVAGIDMKN